MLHHVESGSGAPLVLLHAFPLDSGLWRAQRSDLAEEGFRVITPDLPGFGGTSLSRADPSLDVVADEVAALLDALDLEQAVVGGLSMGGYVTMAMLRRHPQRLRAIVLADTKAAADTPQAAANRLSVADAVEHARRSADLVDAMLPALLGETTRSQRPDVVDKVTRWITAQPAAGVAWAQRAMAGRPDSLADLAAYGGPVLVFYGAEDTISPMADAVAMADAARSGGSAVTVIEVPTVGHLSAVEDPPAVSRAMAGWLRSL